MYLVNVDLSYVFTGGLLTICYLFGIIRKNHSTPITYHLNNNKINIKLDYQFIASTINFLDLTIFREENSLATKVYFKPTDRNSYLSIRSGHHPTWLRNIPRGQLMCIRRYCTFNKDFIQQS